MQQSGNTDMSSTVMDAAIEWMVVFRSGESSAEDHARFACWKNAHPDHETAWQRVSGILNRSFSPLHSTQQNLVAEKALLRQPNASRRGLLRNLFVVGAVGASGAVMLQSGAMRAMAADLRTGTGERKEFVLSDGSRVLLNARSAADVHVSATQRMLRLHEGEVIVAVSSRLSDENPIFKVETECGHVFAASAARFLVRQQGERNLVVVLSGRLEVENVAGQRCTLVAGQGIWFDHQRLDEVSGHMQDQAAWQNGMLIVDMASLGDVIDALRPYRSGFVRIAPAAARLQVLGGFPLDDTDRLLESLAQTLPIRVTFYSRWLILIDLA